MNEIELEFDESSEKEDILTVYRERLMLRFMLAFIPLFLPLILFNFVREQHALAGALGVLLVIVVLNVIAIRTKKYVYLTRTAFIIGLTAAVAIAIVNRGAYGTYWTGPVAIFISFSMARTSAKIYTVVFFVFCTVVMFNVLSAGLALRAVVGLAVTIVFINIFLGIIEKLQDKLVERTVIDPLTKAFNRRQMIPSLAAAIERKRRSGAPASILLFDIDNFKSINDNYGHSVGDRVLKEFVRLVDERSRRLDQIFRIGGEEFLLFLPDTGADGALTLAEEFRELIADADLIKDRCVTVSIGLRELQANETIDDWIKDGDRALYAAKENGKNQVFIRPSPIMSGGLSGGNDLRSVSL